MPKQNSVPTLVWLIVAGIALLVGAAILSPRLSAVTAAPRTEAAGESTLHLPLMQRNDRISTSVFGAQISDFNVIGPATARADEAGITWARLADVSWQEVESAPGVRNWGAMIDDENRIFWLSKHGLAPIVIVRGTPQWARQVPTAACGAIKPDNLDEFASFMHDLVARYSAPPFNVRHFEIYNEPDIDPDLLAGGGNSVFGCWGDESDPYYGGGYYGEMLKAIYPRMKAANPEVKVVLGGLLLFCDHALNPSRCHPSKFLEGILRSGAGSAFDIVSYHGYPLWTNTRQDWERQYPEWRHRGGVVLGKLDFIRTVMDQYGVNKPIILSEAGLLCDREGTCNAAQLQEDQANYAVRVYSRALANGLSGAIWYTFDGPGWRDSGLLDQNQEPRPGFHTVKFLSARLTGAQVIGSELSGELEGYVFKRGGIYYRIYWTNSALSIPVALPGGATVYDKVGNNITPTGSSVNATFEPIIIESVN